MRGYLPSPCMKHCMLACNVVCCCDDHVLIVSTKHRFVDAYRSVSVLIHALKPTKLSVKHNSRDPSPWQRLSSENKTRNITTYLIYVSLIPRPYPLMGRRIWHTSSPFYYVINSSLCSVAQVNAVLSTLRCCI